MVHPCLFYPSDNVWRSRRADAPRYTHFSTVISPSWITEQISVGKCAHRGASASGERQTSFKIVTWTKQTWTKHHNTQPLPSLILFCCSQVRRELYSQCFDEIIRQSTINCVERGLLLLRVSINSLCQVKSCKSNISILHFLRVIINSLYQVESFKSNISILLFLRVSINSLCQVDSCKSNISLYNSSSCG